MTSKAKPLTRGQAFIREDWPGRVAMVAGYAAIAACWFLVAVVTVAGLLGAGWDWILFRMGALGIVFAGAMVDSIYWRRRALIAEKPVSANQFTIRTPLSREELQAMIAKNNAARSRAWPNL